MIGYSDNFVIPNKSGGDIRRSLEHIIENENYVCFIRSSHQSRFVRKGVLSNFAKFTGKHLCQSLFFDKVAGLRKEHKNPT